MRAPVMALPDTYVMSYTFGSSGLIMPSDAGLRRE
jgi:hypothetical protein